MASAGASALRQPRSGISEAISVTMLMLQATGMHQYLTWLGHCSAVLMPPMDSIRSLPPRIRAASVRSTDMAFLPWTRPALVEWRGGRLLTAINSYYEMMNERGQSIVLGATERRPRRHPGRIRGYGKDTASARPAAGRRIGGRV